MERKACGSLLDGVAGCERPRLRISTKDASKAREAPEQLLVLADTQMLCSCNLHL